MAHVVVIGGGMMGLAAAYEAAGAGHRVTVFEADSVSGGMAAHFDLGGLSIERFYHFVCKTDTPTFDLMAELGIADRMRWTPTSMGFFMGGALHRWGDPVSLLRFPHLSLVQKFRYGLLSLVSVRRRAWPALEHESARHWIERWGGRTVYDRMWRPLFEKKFFEYADNISAAWIWTRIHRIGLSRRNLMQEELGYIDGGSETLVRALTAAIEARGGTIHLRTQVEQVVTEAGHVCGVRVGDGILEADAVISTVPLPLVPGLVPDLSEAARAAYAAMVNIGVACVVLLLKRGVSPHFWVNINQPDIDIPGIIEFSNLRPVGQGHVVFVPFYMPVTQPKWQASDAALVAESLDCLRRIAPGLLEDDVIAAKVGRLRYAQPICPPGFAAMIPPVQTEIGGLQIADTSFYYPEDRGTAESIRLGRDMGRRAGL